MLKEMTIALEEDQKKCENLICAIRDFLRAIASAQTSKKYSLGFIVRDTSIIVQGEEKVISFVEGVIAETVFDDNGITFSGIDERDVAKVLLAIVKCCSGREHPLRYSVSTYSVADSKVLAVISKNSEISQNYIQDLIESIKLSMRNGSEKVGVGGQALLQKEGVVV